MKATFLGDGKEYAIGPTGSRRCRRHGKDCLTPAMCGLFEAPELKAIEGVRFCEYCASPTFSETNVLIIYFKIGSGYVGQRRFIPLCWDCNIKEVEADLAALEAAKKVIADFLSAKGIS